MQNETSRSLEGEREGYPVTLVGNPSQLSDTFILTLLGLIVDVIRLAVEVMTMFSKHKADDSKKD